MPLFKYTILFFLLKFCFNAEAQTVITGIVLSENLDTLPGANVYLKNTYDGSSADINGRFQFTTTEKGQQVLVVSMIGYETSETPINIGSNNKNLKITLKEKFNVLNAAVVSAGTMNTGDQSKMAMLNSIDIATTAGATADILGALKTLPGTLPASEDDGLFVRGGDAGEMRTYFDGVSINKLFTSDLPDVAQRGRFSPFMFKGITFSAGGYSAKYGQALSSVLLLESKSLAPKTKSDFGLMTVGFSGNHTQRFTKSSADLNVAYYNLSPIYSIIKQNTDWVKAPESFNTNCAFKSKTNDNGIIKTYIDYTNSNTILCTYNFNDISRTSEYNVSNNNLLINSTLNQYLGKDFNLEFGIGFSTDNQTTIIDDTLAHNNFNSVNSRIAFDYFLNQSFKITSGFEINRNSTYESFYIQNHEVNSNISSAYAETDIHISKKVNMVLGLRSEYAAIIAKSNLAPRAAIAVKTGEHSQVAAAAGMFYQNPADKFLFDNTHLQFEEASHLIINYQYEKNSCLFRTEVYYKKYENLIKVNNLTETISNDGYGYSKGLDLFWRDSKNIKHCEYWLSYSYLNTKRNYLNYPYAATPPFAASHVANAVIKYTVAKWNTVTGITYTYASGRTYYNPNAEIFLSDKTKSYHNLSINASYLTSIARCFTIVYLSIENVAGIDHVYGYRYSPDGQTRKAIESSAPRTIFAGLFITIGDNSFK